MCIHCFGHPVHHTHTLVNPEDLLFLTSTQVSTVCDTPRAKCFIIHPCDPTVVICYLIWPCDIAVRITYLMSHSN